jgi:hypothetical protein
MNNTFDNPLEVTQTAREYLAQRLQKETLKAANFAAHTGAAPLVIPLLLKPEYREQFRKHPRFASMDLVDVYWLAKAYLKGAKSFPLPDRETCVAVLLIAMAGNQMPTLPRLTLQHEDGRKFRA